MSCTCLAALLNAIKPPWVELPALNLPPCMAQLTAMAGGLAGAGALADASVAARLSAIASLNLPPLPISVNLLARMTAAASAVAQIKANLGLDLFSPDASLRLSAIFADLNAFPLAALPLPAVGALGPLLAIMGVIKVSLGIDLLAPGAAVALQASASAMVSAAASFKIALPTLSLIASYSALASAAAALGVSANLGALGGRLQMLASLQLPSLNLNPMLLAQLLNFLAALASAKRMLGIDPFSVGAAVKLQAALAPLSLLASVKLSAEVSAAAALGSAVAAASSQMSADFSAMASLNLGAAASVKLPNLAPAMMLSAVVGQARTSSSCSSSCPVRM